MNQVLFRLTYVCLALVYLFLLQNPIHAKEEDIEKKIQKAYRTYKLASTGEKNQKDLDFLITNADEDGKDHPLAQYYLGLLFYHGKSVDEDLKRAIRLFYAAAWNDHEGARKQLEKLAETNLVAQRYCGSLYYHGRGIDEDLSLAAWYYHKSAWNKNKAAHEVLLDYARKDKRFEEYVKEEVCRYILEGKGTLNQSFGRVALFRGIHFVTNLFDAEAITENTRADHVGKFLVSSAACKLTGKGFLSGSLSDAELEAGKLICKILQKFKTDSPDLYDKFHETYTNNHERFHSCLEDPMQWEDEVTQQAFLTYRRIFKNSAKDMYPDTWDEAVKRNPFVSFSCNAKHAQKYGFGQKSFTGGADVKLLPDYSRKGQPKNRFLGRIYVAILSPADIRRLLPTFVVDKHAKNKVNISTHYGNNILSENEVSFFGYLPDGFIQFSQLLEVPEFVSDSDDFSSLDYDKQFRMDKRKYVRWYEQTQLRKSERDENFESEIISHIVEETWEDVEREVNHLVRKQEGIRIYPDIFEHDYTHISDNSSQLMVAKWLHAINAQESIIASSPITGDRAASADSIRILSSNLSRRPTSLWSGWASYLTIITMSFCNLEGSGASFRDILENKKVPLRELYLRDCQLVREDTRSIARSLSDNEFLRVLVLDRNKVSDRGAKVFAESLESNTTLERLSLYSTSITDITSFANLFPSGGDDKSLNKSLIELNLDFDLSFTHLKTIQKGLHRNLKRKDRNPEDD